MRNAFHRGGVQVKHDELQDIFLHDTVHIPPGHVDAVALVYERRRIAAAPVRVAFRKKSFSLEHAERGCKALHSDGTAGDPAVVVFKESS